MAVITLNDLEFSIDTLSDAIAELAHEIAALQNEMDELKEKKKNILDEPEQQQVVGNERKLS